MIVKRMRFQSPDSWFRAHLVKRCTSYDHHRRLTAPNRLINTAGKRPASQFQKVKRKKLSWTFLTLNKHCDREREMGKTNVFIRLIKVRTSIFMFFTFKKMSNQFTCKHPFFFSCAHSTSMYVKPIKYSSCSYFLLFFINLWTQTSKSFFFLLGQCLFPRLAKRQRQTQFRIF